jgi:hypothetical protein
MYEKFKSGQAEADSDLRLADVAQGAMMAVICSSVGSHGKIYL